MKNEVRSPFNDFLALLQRSSKALPPDDLAALINQHPINITDVLPWVAFDPTLYSRNQIAKFPFAEVLVMCWKSGQLTPIHDHAGSACAVRVLSGTATEIHYQQSGAGVLVPTHSERYETGAVFHSYDSEMHQMGNLESNEANLVTLHCYSPPLRGFQIFDGMNTFFSDYSSLYQRAASRIAKAQGPAQEEP